MRWYDTSGSIEEYYYLHDANFNVVAVTNFDGGPAERYRYTPYGEVTFLEPDFSVKSTQESGIGNTHLYTGRERDPETGLQLNRHRYYAAHLGRWLTRDPLGYWSADANLYQYVRANPTFFTDPTGAIAIPPEPPPTYPVPIVPPNWPYNEIDDECPIPLPPLPSIIDDELPHIELPKEEPNPAPIVPPWMRWPPRVKIGPGDLRIDPRPSWPPSWPPKGEVDVEYEFIF